MKLLTVVPISHGIQKETLTYFSATDIENGAMVSIPLRKKSGCGVVIDSQPVSEQKSEIKSLSYSIKKIDGKKTSIFLSSDFIEAARQLADYFVTSTGAVLHSLMPSKILASIDKIQVPEINKDREKNFREVQLLQAGDSERYAAYKSIIREEFARGGSVFFILPTTEDLAIAGNLLEKGIEGYSYRFHSGLTSKEIEERWQSAVKNPHPVLVMATGPFLSLPRRDLSCIIVDRESSRAYKTQSRPYLDIRTAAETIARVCGYRLILGDVLLRIETIWREQHGSAAALSPLQFRLLSAAAIELVSMRQPANMTKKTFSIFSDKLKEIISLAHERNERTFLFTGRKGLYPTTVCSDCGTVVTCNNCGAPVVLYGKTRKSPDNNEKGNLFVCHHCGERRDAAELCVHCRGWRLLPMGLGTDRVCEEIENLFPGRQAFVLDKEHVQTHAKAVKMRDAFLTSPGSVMIGTEMALPYLSEPIENTAVVSADSLFSLPDFRAGEKIFHIILALRNIAEKRCLIQTRRADTTLIEQAVRGNLFDFYRAEIEERTSFNFPPISTYIKLSLQGRKQTIKNQITEIVKNLSDYKPNIIEGFTPKEGPSVIHALICLPHGSWIDQKLLAILRALPPSVGIKVDPDSLL